MAQVTIELRNLLESNFELFDFDYEFDDQAFKKELEEAIINEYYFHEIGQETPDHFKHVFKKRWLSAMSYYNKLHNTTLLEYNPLINYSMSEALEQLKTTDSQQNTTQNVTTQGTAESTANDTTNTENTSTDESISESKRTDNLAGTNNTNEVTSNYPQQPIAGGDFADGGRVTDNDTTSTGTVDNEGTTSSDRSEEGESVTVSTAEASNNDEQDTTAQQLGEVVDNTTYEKNIEGITGITYQDLIMKERNNMLRIVGMVIEEMKPCFILIY